MPPVVEEKKKKNGTTYISPDGKEITFVVSVNWI